MDLAKCKDCGHVGQPEFESGSAGMVDNLSGPGMVEAFPFSDEYTCQACGSDNVCEGD